MTDDEIQQERVLFEAWATKRFPGDESILQMVRDIKYLYSDTALAWQAWLASAEQRRSKDES